MHISLLRIGIHLFILHYKKFIHLSGINVINSKRQTPSNMKSCRYEVGSLTAQLIKMVY